MNESSAHSSYNAMTLTANFQLPHRSQLSANYTLARARDDNSNLGPFTLVSALNPFNLAADAAYSSFDVRNSFNLSAITNLQWGVKINPVLVTRSGLPYTPIIGFDTQNDANDWNDRAILNGWLRRAISLRQPAFFDLDIRFVKDITLPGEGRHLDLFMDIFNITELRIELRPRGDQRFRYADGADLQRRPSAVCTQHQSDRAARVRCSLR